MLSDSHTAALREAFLAAGYRVDDVVAAIGEEAHRALGRNQTVPAVRALGDRDDALATLTALWPLQRRVSRSTLERALPSLVPALLDAGVLAGDGDSVRAEVDIRPYDSVGQDPLWIVSDLTPGLDTRISPIRPDFVLGVSSASSSLAQLTVRRPVARALDLGTGCGVQSMHLARHAKTIVGTDLNPRALTLAALTAKINGVAVDLRPGSLFDPVAGELFDLIITNPPYVMSPPTSDADRLVYREGDWPADGLVEQVVRRGADHLADDGILQVLGNWAHPRDGNWQSRLQGWISPTGCDAHVVQRETLDPAAYVELWLADAGLAGSPHYDARFHAWLDYLAALGIEAVGMGWITLHRAGRQAPVVALEDWPYGIEQPIGPAIDARLAAVDLEQQLGNDELLNRHWVRADDIGEESFGTPGAADPQHIVLRQQRGFRRAVAADTALAAVVGTCDGELRLGQIIDATAGLLAVDPTELTAELLPRVRELVVDGFLGLED